MTAQKISELTAATTPLAGTEVVPVLQDGTNKKTTAADIAALAPQGDITGVTAGTGISGGGTTGTVTVALADTAVTPGSYTHASITVDQQGRLTAASSGSVAGTDLSYDAATRLLSSSTGSDVTLPEVSSTEAGLAPASGGGTSTFLRADGTWASASASPGGSDTQVQFNSGGSLAGSADLTWDDTGKTLTVGGDIDLDDGGTYATTLQVITPTANRTISFPDATGTVGLVGGSSGQVIYNNAGAYGGVSTMTFNGTSVTLAGRLINSYTSLASSPAKVFTGTWFTGGTATTTKPHFLIEPTGTTSTAWSTSGTGLGVNAASGFAGNLLDLQVNGTKVLNVTKDGHIFLKGDFTTGAGIYATNLAGVSFRGSGAEVLFAGWGAGISTVSANFIGWGDTYNASANVNLRLFKDAANTLAQRNGTDAQTLRVYGTYTDASNHVRASLSSTSTAVTLAAETAGTGADDIPLNLTAAGTGTVKVNSNLEVADAKGVVLGTTTGTKIGTATTQKLGFYNATPVVQPTAVADITTTATSGSLPTPDGTVTIADATTPTVTELLEYCVELEAKLEAALGHLRTLGLIAT